MGRQRDSVDFWFNASGKYPLLPQAEMLRLGSIIQNPEAAAAARQKAVTKLVRHNLRLIPSIVKRVIGPKRSAKFGDTLTEDLLQSGVIGLTRAAEKFDPTLGYSFTTYANMWIYQAVQREALGYTSMIRIPEHTIRDYYAVYGDRKKDNFNDLCKNNRQRITDAHFAINCFSLEESLKSQTTENDYHQVVHDPSQVELTDTFEELLELAPLNEAQQEMLDLIYKQNVSKKEAARRLGLTRDKLNRLHDLAIRQLRFAISR